MNSITKVIDINAHVQNVTCQVAADAETCVATIGFDNLGYGTITAIKFNAIGYNSFGDVVLVNGKETFLLIIQDISVERNAKVKELKANLPNLDIRKLYLVEAQICFADGTVASYAGEDSRRFELEEYDLYGTDKDVLYALKKKFGQNFRYKPIACTEGWICGCGQFNHQENVYCTCCKNNKADEFKFTMSEESIKLVEAYKKAKEIQEEANRQEAKRKEKEKKKRRIRIGIGAVVAMALAYFIVHVSTLAGRTTYASESEMKSAVAGTYTCYDGNKARYQLKVTRRDTVIKRWINLGKDYDLSFDVSSWNPANGTFKTSLGTIIVTSDGNLKYDGNIYEKGGSWSSKSSDSSYSSSFSNSSYESGATVLKIQDVKVSKNSSCTICTGTVKNTGSKTYKYIRVKGAFKDSE